MKTQNYDQPPKTTRSRFTWGPIRKLHRIGDDYVVVEYTRQRSANVTEATFEPGASFHPYVRVPDEKTGKIRWDDTHHSYRTLDAAIVACVAYRNLWTSDGASHAMNEKATGYFLKMVGA